MLKSIGMLTGMKISSADQEQLAKLITMIFAHKDDIEFSTQLKEKLTELSDFVTKYDEKHLSGGEIVP
jgi:hypothetical protein